MKMGGSIDQAITIELFGVIRIEPEVGEFPYSFSTNPLSVGIW